jgi:hypothetical protein
MGARRAAPNPVRGVGKIQTKFAASERLRVAVGAAATAIAVAIAVLLTLAVLSSVLAIVLALVAVVAVVVGLADPRSHVFPSALAALGLAGLVELLEGALPTRITPLLGGSLLACAELGYWSYELGARVRHSAIGVVRRGAVILVLVALGTAISGLGVAAIERLTTRIG